MGRVERWGQMGQTCLTGFSEKERAGARGDFIEQKQKKKRGDSLGLTEGGKTMKRGWGSVLPVGPISEGKSLDGNS